MSRSLRGKRVLIAAALAVTATSVAAATQAKPNRLTERSVYALANRCFTVRSADGQASGPYYLKPTGLGTFMLYQRDGRLHSAAGGTTSTAGPQAQWRITPDRARTAYEIRATATGAALPGAPFTFHARSGCRPFPEAGLDATGRTFRGTNRNGTVFGFVDDHLHITGDMRAGGDVISGQAFNRFGIVQALGQDAKIHGKNGRLDLTGNLLRTGVPVGTHDTHGWPTFTGWPTYNSQTHQQVYWGWLKRAWEAGERLIVAQTVDDRALCRLVPRRRFTCNETRSIENQITRLKQMQTYIDAQSGGPGKGFFRIVYSPAQARQVIESGKLAVIIGIESSDLLGCGVREGRAQCTRAEIDQRLAHYIRLGVRGMFVAHWVNNAFSGAALEGGVKGLFINILNRFSTGSYFKTGPCPGKGQGVEMQTLSQGTLKLLSAFFPAARRLAEHGMPKYPAGLQCNTEGLTPLGRYLISRLIAKHMLIEVDHMSEPARDTLLGIAARAHYPLISSHNGTGGTWTPAELVKLFGLGGFAAVTPDVAPKLAQKILKMGRYRPGFGVGIGTDTNGLGSQPGPPPDAKQHPLHYPFTLLECHVTFTREQTGTRAFDLNRDGVAQYGLLPDLFGDMQRTSAGRRALSILYHSAEAYLETWQRAFAHGH